VRWFTAPKTDLKQPANLDKLLAVRLRCSSEGNMTPALLTNSK